MCLIGCFVPDTVRYLMHASGLLCFMRIKYTRLSLLMLVYAAIEEVSSRASSALVPILLVNFCGLSAAFHSAYLFDRDAFVRLAKKNEMTMSTFWLLNFGVHVLPVMALSAWFFGNPGAYTVDRYTGVYTALFHVLWSLRAAGGLNLSPLYAECSDETWYGIWTVGVTTHMFTGHLIYVLQ